MKRVALASLSVLLVAARSDAADPASSPSPSPPPLVLAVTPGTSGGPWKLRVENTGDVPVRIAADPRLLVLDVAPPAGAGDADAKPAAKRASEGPVRCALPADARPASDEGRELVLPGKRAWSASFDPAFYCFSARERAALRAGAVVTARLGWPSPAARGGKAAKVAPPFVAAPVGAAVGKVDPTRELEAAPFTLADAAAAPPAPAPAPEDDKPRLSLSMPDAEDALRGAQLSATVTLANEGDRAATLLLRPTTLSFSVSGPQGSVQCGAPASIASPIRELFTTVAPKGRSSLTVLVDSLCPAGTFDAPGVYRVTPSVDTTNASGRRLGIKSFDGKIVGKAPMLLRVRTPRRLESPSRPSLD